MKREGSHFDKEFKEMTINLCLTGKLTKEVADELSNCPLCQLECNRSPKEGK